MFEEAKRILVLAGEDPYRALFEVWFRLTQGRLDSLHFVELAARSATDREHLDRVAEFVDSLRGLAEIHASARVLQQVRKDADEHLLALLVALDQWAYEEHDPGGLDSLHTAEGASTQFYVRQRHTPLDERSSYVHQPLTIQHWLRRHWIFPCVVDGRRLRLHGMKASERRTARAVGTRESLRVAIASFDDASSIDWRTDGPNHFARGLVARDQRWKSVEAVLTRASDEGVDVLVLPELTIDPPMRERVQTWLAASKRAPLFLVPGSFHVTRATVARNEAELLFQSGRALLCHHKLRPFARPEKSAPFVEEIVPGAELGAVETPLGRIAVGICLDHCDESAGTIELWNWLAPDWALVPAMDGRVGLHAYQQAGRRLCRAHGTATLQANQPVAGTEEGESAPVERGMVVLPRGSDGNHFIDTSDDIYRVYDVPSRFDHAL